MPGPVLYCDTMPILDATFALCLLVLAVLAARGQLFGGWLFPSRRRAVITAGVAGLLAVLLVARIVAILTDWTEARMVIDSLFPAIALGATAWVVAISLRFGGATHAPDEGSPSGARIEKAAIEDAGIAEGEETHTAAALTARTAFFVTATANAQIGIFAQDRDLRYTWAHNPRLAESPDDMIGRRDDDVLPEEAREQVIAAKRRVLETGQAETFEVELPEGDSHSWFRVTTSPLRGDDDGVIGIISTAVDITRAKRLEIMRRDLNERLSDSLRRLTVAMHASGVVVFSQDTDLRYVWVSHPESLRAFGVEVGMLETEAPASEALLTSLSIKRQALESGERETGELRLGRGEDARWFELTVEPTRAESGDVVGITGAMVDVTDRKKHEQRMRVVMRELSHRSKNLMAVIQAVANQTARNAPDLPAFTDAFLKRLRAMAAAQDALVEANWGRAPLERLIETVLTPMRPRAGRLSLSGPAVLVPPKAAQPLALAFHELMTNALKYGALSNDGGKVEIAWEWTGPEQGADGPELLLRWRESGGPPVGQPAGRGFGTVLVEDNVAAVLSARVALDYDPAGLRVEFAIPKAALEGAEAAPHSSIKSL